MARKPRIDYPGAWHHMMNRGAARCLIFGDSFDRVKFLSLVGKASAKFGVEVHAYALMGNHYHVLVRSLDGRLSEFAKLISEQYTRFYNSRYERDGALFRGRFHSVLAESDDYLLWVSRYIHLNPVDGVIGTDPSACEWSSYGAYTGARRGEPWLSRSFLLAMAGGSARDYQNYVESVGLSEWVKQDDVALLERLSAAAELVASGGGLVEATTLSRSGRTVLNAALLVGARSMSLSAGRLAEHFGLSSANLVRQRIRTIDSRSAKEERVADIVKRITELAVL